MRQTATLKPDALRIGALNRYRLNLCRQAGAGTEMRRLDFGVSDRGQGEVGVLKIQPRKAHVTHRLVFGSSYLYQLRQHRSDRNRPRGIFARCGEVGQRACTAVEKPFVRLIQCEPGVLDEGRLARSGSEIVTMADKAHRGGRGKLPLVGGTDESAGDSPILIDHQFGVLAAKTFLRKCLIKGE